jgi:hypothetical protein
VVPDREKPEQSPSALPKRVDGVIVVVVGTVRYPKFIDRREKGENIMSTRCLALTVLVVMALSGSTVLAQCGCGPVATAYMPITPSYPAYYAPVAEPYVAAYTPYVASYAPYTAYYSPYAAYHSPYVASYAPYAAYAPVVRPYGYYGAPGWSAYGTPKVYVRGEPVRNALRAATP